jgi:hypothetical protein
MTRINKVNLSQLAPCDVVSSTITGSAVDIRELEGDVLFTQFSDATNGANVTLDGKIQDSADGSTGWADVSGATFTQVDNTAGGAMEQISVPANSMERYVRYVGTIAGTTPSFACGAHSQGLKKVR